IGGGVDTSPRGFTGFLQNMGEAKREAKSAGKTILVVFGSSDSDADTRELAASLQTPEFKQLVSERFIPVVIDFPRTRDGYNLVQDTAQNRGMLEEYQIQSLPTVALVDERGKPFFIKREWDDDYELRPSQATEWLAERKKR